jgi:hypothetical protein
MRQVSAIVTNVSLVNLARRAYWEFHEGKLPQFCFRWPIYDAWRHFSNAESRRLYALEKERMTPGPLEQRVIQELRKTGIALVQVGDLMPGKMFSEIQEWGEALLRAPAIQERITAIEGGARLQAKSDKYYIVRPMGDEPVYDTTDSVVEVNLSEAMLRIACGYLGMFCRLSALDLWYNVAIDGPDMFSQRWHRDPDDRTLLKTFLHLRDVDETNGPFCYVPGTHNAGPLRQKIGRYNYPDDGVIEGKFPPHQRKICTGKAGTLIFCDTTGFHKGGHPTTGARFLFNAVYTTNASVPLARGVGQFFLKGSRKHFPSPAASYAVGRVGDGQRPGREPRFG